MPCFMSHAQHCPAVLRRFVAGCVGLLKHESVDVQEVSHLDVVKTSDLAFPTDAPRARVGVVKLAVELYHTARFLDDDENVSVAAVKDSLAGVVKAPQGPAVGQQAVGTAQLPQNVQVTVQSDAEATAAAVACAVEKALEKKNKRELASLKLEDEVVKLGLHVVLAPECWPPVLAVRELKTVVSKLKKDEEVTNPFPFSELRK